MCASVAPGSASNKGKLERMVACTWVIDPAPLAPHAALPELNLADWRQLQTLSHKERELILRVSGFSAHAWGARGVYLGSDLSHADWAAAVDKRARPDRTGRGSRRPKQSPSSWTASH
jgi:hypothetical protein